VVALRRLPPALQAGPAALASGVARARWPGRWQKLVSGPMVELLPAGWELRLDGGHNPAAAAVIATTLDMLPARPLHLVIGMLNTKDAAAFLKPLLSRARSCTMVPIPDEPLSRPPGELAAVARSLGFEAATAEHHLAALRRIVASPSQEPALVLLCGSLHFAGTVLADHG
jgi:dihydrofolate synthase/folylpolyglutamate synthase